MNNFFSIFGKITLALIVVGLLVGGGIYLGKNSSLKVAPTPTSALEKKPTPTPEKEQMVVPTIAPTSSVSLKGSIKGVLGYPAEGIPPLEVYAISTTDKSKFFFIKTAQNQGTFTIEDVEPGTYNVVAYSVDYKVSGGYTKAVPCGLSVNCKDHSFIPVEVKSGEVASGVEVKDWYAPEGTFPAKPQ